MAIVPNENDVLFGRGYAAMAHPGNAKLRDVVRANKPRFDQTRRIDKREIAYGIVDLICGRGGRFLVEDPRSAKGPSALSEKMWILVEREKAVDKVMHRLRDEKVQGGTAGGQAASLQHHPDIELLQRYLPPSVGLNSHDPPIAGSFISSNTMARNLMQSWPNPGQYGGASSEDLSLRFNNMGMQQSMGNGLPSQMGMSQYSLPSIQNASNAETQNVVGSNFTLDGRTLTGGMPPASSGAPITVQDWMKLAGDSSPRNSLGRAVELALMLTRTLRDRIGSGMQLSLEDIRAENIQICMERTADTQGIVPSIQAVGIIAKSANGTPIQPRAACAALGKMLLQIFTQNRSSSMDEPTQEDDCVDKDDTNSSRKRHLSLPGNGRSKQARNLLAELELPLSVCRLVCDLLDAESDPCPRTAITALDEALFDLEQMRANPESFLYDRTSPQRAADDTGLFGSNGADDQLFGRERELSILMDAAFRVSSHIRAKGDIHDFSSLHGPPFLCEVALLKGYAGSGKSSLLRPLVRSCTNEGWFVLHCKFDRHIAPHTTLFEAIDELFGKYQEFSPTMAVSFRQACESINTAVDEEGLKQLCALVPNAAKIFLLHASKCHSPNLGAISSIDKVGSAQKRLKNLLHVLLKSLCCSRCPMLFEVEDLQWCDLFILESLSDFLVSYMHSSISGTGVETSQGGLFLAGAYRSNEVKEGDDLLRTIDYLKKSKKATVTTINVGELTKADITQLISARLCLPWRYTRDLATMVHSKTRGNPFFVIQFLRTILHNKMLEYSVKQRRWLWDCEVVDLQMISEGVAELLTSTFSQLPSELVETMKVASCLGCQVHRSTIDALDSTREVLTCRMLGQMELAIEEGILERAGPVYQFTHDIIQQTVYSLIPEDTRAALQKSIGMSLLLSAPSDPTIHMLAVDQINAFCQEGGPTSEERSLFANSNVQAAKFAIASSSFERARSYCDAGISLLDKDHWKTQYTLSLELFELSATVSCFNADLVKMASRLDALLTNVKTFDDSLTGAGLLARLLASNSKYAEARSNCLEILKHLEEEFPSEVDLPFVRNELQAMDGVLRSITLDRIRQLQPMTNKTKRNAMRFLRMLSGICGLSKPLLLPILGCRMVNLSLEYGLCDDSIVGIATAGYSLILFTEDIALASSLGRVSEALVADSPKKNTVKARMNFEFVSTLRMMNQPWQAAVELYPDYYSAAMLAGDEVKAMMCRFAYCGAGFWTGSMGLDPLSKQLVLCIQEATKYKLNAVTYGAMSVYAVWSHLSGKRCAEVEVITFDALNELAGNAPVVQWQIFMSQLTSSFWSRNFSLVAKLAEKHRATQKNLFQKRILGIFCTFYKGLSYLNLARGSMEAEWGALAESSFDSLSELERTLPAWNIENKILLLQAERHYLNGAQAEAEAAYEASIKSAQEHKFVHEEALALEMYGIYCIENGLGERGSMRLLQAIGKYQEWGAIAKANEVQLYLDAVDAIYMPQKP